MRRVVIDLERGERPISGTVRTASVPERAFVWWIGLLAALEAALGTTVQEAADSAPGPLD